MDIHQIAANFLREIERGNAVYKEEQTNVEAVASVTGLVALRRAVNPPYFYGFKPSGRPIFTHDIRLAKSFSTSHPSLAQHIDHLATIGVEVSQHLTVWSEGRHHSE